MREASIKAGIPKFLFVFHKVNAAAKDEAAWPEGKEKPDGGEIRSWWPGNVTNGRGLATSGLIAISPMICVTASTANRIIPSLRYFFDTIRHRPARTQISP